MSFFSNMNLPRLVIVASLLGSAVLGYFVYERTRRLDEVQRELKQVPELVKEIQQLGITLDQYQQLADGTEGTDFDYDPYIRRIASEERTVGIGQVKIGSPSTRSPMKDVTDTSYKISPASPNQKYSRSKIGNFLFKLEADSRRVKVTSLELRPADKVRSGEVGNDVWVYEATITSRTKDG